MTDQNSIEHGLNAARADASNSEQQQQVGELSSELQQNPAVNAVNDASDVLAGNDLEEGHITDMKYGGKWW